MPILHQIGNALDHRGLVHLVRNLGDDDALALRLVVDLDLGLRAHDDAPAAREVRVMNPLAPIDDAAGRKIGPRDELHQLFAGDLGVVEHRNDCVGGLAQVVRWNVRCHPHRDPGSAIYKQVGKRGWQDDRHLAGVVVVRNVVDRVLVDVTQYFAGDCAHARFRVALGRGRVAIDRAEVALSVDERIAQ